jgi:hypothetical protein
MAGDHLLNAAWSLVAIRRTGSVPSAGLISFGVTSIVAAIVLFAFNDRMERNYGESSRDKGLPALRDIPFRKKMLTIELFFLVLGVIVVAVSFFVHNRR